MREKNVEPKIILLKIAEDIEQKLHSGEITIRKRGFKILKKTYLKVIPDIINKGEYKK